MDWWVALMVAGVPAAITGASLIVQQRFSERAAARADESRRIDAEAERKHQERMLEATNAHAREQAEQDHRRKVRESWKADRRAAHTRLLTRLEEIQAKARTLLSTVSVDLAIDDLSTDTNYDLPPLPQEMVADVALMGSDTSAQAAQQASNAVAVLGISVLTIEFFASESREQVRSYIDRAEEALTKLTSAVATYRQAAKQDIDTVD